MTLAERLEELNGRHVKIGVAAGFIFCGEAFPGLCDLLDEIAKEARARMSDRLARATRVYRERDTRWAVRVSNVAYEVEVQKANVESYTWEKERLELFLAKANRLLDKHRRSTKAAKVTKLIKIKNHIKQAQEDNAFKLSAAEKGVKRYTTLYATMQTPDAKARQFAAWKKAVDNYTAEIKKAGKLSTTEILDEYPSAMRRGERIIILDSALSGPYWYDEEMLRDPVMMERIRNAKRKGAKKEDAYEYDIV